MCFVYCGVVLLTDVWIVQSSDIRSYSTIVIFVNSDVVVVPGTHQTIIHRGTDTFSSKMMAMVKAIFDIDTSTKQLFVVKVCMMVDNIIVGAF